MILIGLLVAGTLQVPAAPDCSPPEWGDKVTRFHAQMEAYAELRGRLEQATPSRSVAGQRIRAARAAAKQGDMFTPAIGVEFKRALAREVNAHTWKVIMDDNPGEMLAQVNGLYPAGKPLSTMPPNVLAVLPRLPPDVEYRFVERTMILLDTRTKLILELTPDFEVRSAGAADSFWAAHARLEREGRITHAAAACPSRNPKVRVWSPRSGWRAVP